MSRNRFTDEFKCDAVAQVVDRGYVVSEVAERLGVSTKSLYTWKARFSKPAKEAKIDTGQSRDIRRLKAELARVTEERDILKKATVRRPAGEWHIHRERTSRGMQSEVCLCCRVSPTIFSPCDVPLPAYPPQWFYAWLKNPLCKRAAEDTRQTDLIKGAWKDSCKVYEGYSYLAVVIDLYSRKIIGLSWFARANHCQVIDGRCSHASRLIWFCRHYSLSLIAAQSTAGNGWLFGGANQPTMP